VIGMNGRTGLSKAQRDFRRSLEQARKSRYTPAQRERLLKIVERDFLQNPDVPNLLRDLSEGASGKILHYDRNGLDVAVKDVTGGHLAGSDYENYLEFHRLHRLAVSEGLISPKSYRLVPVTPFGTFTVNGRKYLVMERIKQFKPSPLSFLAKRGFWTSRASAMLELDYHAGIIRNKYGITPPQSDRDILTFGSISPPKQKRKVWILGLPNDVG